MTGMGVDCGVHFPNPRWIWIKLTTPDLDKRERERKYGEYINMYTEA